jgi:hypothetical protein
MVAGLLMGNTGPNDATFDMGSFLATRPLTDRQMARTILKTAGLSVCCSWILWAAAFLILTLILRAAGAFIPQGIPPELGWWYFPATLLGPWVVAAVGAAIGLTGRSALLLKIFCGVLTLTVGVTLFAKFVLPGDAQRVLFLTLVGLIETACLVGTVWLFAAARRRGLVPMPTVYAAAAVWCVLVTIVMADWMMHPQGPARLYLFAATVVTLAVTPLAAAPLALSINRHR